MELKRRLNPKELCRLESISRGWRMNIQEVTVEGILEPDGTLRLAAKPPITPGKVVVILRHEPKESPPEDDPFWQRMKAIWAIPIAREDGGVRSQEEVKKMRAEWEEHQQKLIELQSGSMSRLEIPCPV